MKLKNKKIFIERNRSAPEWVKKKNKFISDVRAGDIDALVEPVKIF